MGFERLYSEALRIGDRDKFIAFMNQDQPIRPANIANIVALNQGKKEGLPAGAPLLVLDAAQVAERIAAGHIVVDTRSPAEFGAGHIAGAYNMQLSGSEFEQRVGWVTPIEPPIILVAASDEEARHARYKLGFVGLDHRVAGYLQGGMENWIINRGLEHHVLPQITVQQASNKAARNGFQILDVREESEWNDGHAENAIHMNFKYLGDRLGELNLSPEQQIGVVCAGGMRSSTASSILLKAGYKNVVNIIGGMHAWQASGLPVVTT